MIRSFVYKGLCHVLPTYTHSFYSCNHWSLRAETLNVSFSVQIEKQEMVCKNLFLRNHKKSVGSSKFGRGIVSCRHFGEEEWIFGFNANALLQHHNDGGRRQWSPHVENRTRSSTWQATALTTRQPHRPRCKSWQTRLNRYVYIIITLNRITQVNKLNWIRTWTFVMLVHFPNSFTF